MVVSGPPARLASPVVKIIPSVNGNDCPFPVKYPMPLVEPKSVPVSDVMFETSAHELLINTSSINSSTV